MTNLHRSQILLESEQHRALADIARREQRSISEIVREIVGQFLTEQQEEELLQRQLGELEALDGLREGIFDQHGTVAIDFLEEAREEREMELDRVLKGEA